MIGDSVNINLQECNSSTFFWGWALELLFFRGGGIPDPP